MRTALVSLFTALTLLAPLSAHADACVADGDSFVCGEGKGAMRVLADTISPNKQYAVAWRSSAGLPVKGESPNGDVENLLIRISDGQVLAKLGSEYWTSGEMRPNRFDFVTAWSPDSRAVIDFANSRWDTDAFGYHRIDGATAETIDLLALVSPALKGKLPAAKRDNYAFRVREDAPIKLDNAGHARFGVMLYIPKSDPFSYYRVQVDIAGKNGKATARIVSVQKTGE